MFWAVLMCFSPYLGIGRTGGGGSSKGLIHSVLKQFFNLDISKIEVFEKYFFDR